MGQSALGVIRDQIEWAQDRLMYAATEHITDSFDSFPAVGIGLSFVKRSAEKIITQKVENSIAPDVEQYIELQMAFIAELSDADDPEAVKESYRDDLLEKNPFLQVIDAPDATRDDLRETVWDHNLTSADRVLDWLDAAGSGTFENYVDLAVQIGKTPDEVGDEIRHSLNYIEMLEKHREHVDMSMYSSVLEHGKVHDWFLTHLIEGLKQGRQDVIEEVQEQLAERRELE